MPRRSTAPYADAHPLPCRTIAETLFPVQHTFFSVVTHRRQPLFDLPEARVALRQAIKRVQKRFPFESPAMVLLPDHLHCIWTLPRTDDAYDVRWRRIKSDFSRRYRRTNAKEGIRTASRIRRGERGFWQRRYWEHTVDNEGELKRCVDYIHWNPVKHGLAERPWDWQWSTFRRHVREGEYEADWGRTDPCPDLVIPE